jgi:hypothetical protein
MVTVPPWPLRISERAAAGQILRQRIEGFVMYPVERRVPGASPRPYTGVDTVFSVCPPISANGMDRLHPHSTPTEMRLQAPKLNDPGPNSRVRKLHGTG